MCCLIGFGSKMIDLHFEDPWGGTWEGVMGISVLLLHFYVTPGGIGGEGPNTPSSAKGLTGTVHHPSSNTFPIDPFLLQVVLLWWQPAMWGSHGHGK